MTAAPSMTAPYAATIPALEAWLAATYRGRVRAADPAGETRFEQIHAQAGAIARGLIGQGLAKGARVGVLMPNGADYLAVMTGIQRAGGQAVLMSTLARPAELAQMVRHSDIDTLIMADRYLGNDYAAILAEGLPSLAGADGTSALRLAEAPYLHGIWLVGGRAPRWARGTRSDLEALGAPVTEEFLAAVEQEIVPADPAVIIYSSGTTAEPKAVIHSHGNVTRQTWRMSRYMTYRPGDRLMTTMPFFWVGGLCTSMYAANICGAAIVCPATPSLPGMLEAVDAHRVTHVSLWPARLRALISSPGFGDFRERLKPISAQQLGLFGLAAPERTPNALGMSETFGPHSMELPDGPLPEDHAGSFGRAVDGIERKIIDPETGAELPAGEIGELVVRGGATMIGYHRKEYAETFDRDGFFHTGDLASLGEDGHLYFRGRSGNMIKTAGVNVSPREVEAALLAEPEVMDAITLGVPDDVSGEIVVSVAVLRPGLDLDEQTLKARLGTRLSSYKLPRHILFVDPGELPRTPSDKVQIKPLLALVQERLGI